MLTGQLPVPLERSRHAARDAAQRAAAASRARSSPTSRPQAEAIILELLEKDVRKRFQDAHHLQEELKALQRSLPSQPWDVGASRRDAAAPPPPPPPQSPGVIEWASRAALFSRMVSRALPVGQRAAGGADRRSRKRGISPRAPTRLEGEVASHTRKLEALERRGRALRAEIGRKVEELAHEESRALREAAAEQQEAEKLRGELVRPPSAPRRPRRRRPIRPRSRAATRRRSRDLRARRARRPRSSRRKRERLARARARRRARRQQARDLRRQIDELRAQLARYAEALEEDLAAGREKVAARTREGLTFEKAVQRRRRSLSIT